jgi:hypothetical protein
MTALVAAIDVSDSQPKDLSALIAKYGATHVVVKLYLMAEGGKTKQTYTLMQAASAKASGASVGGYVWGYSSEDPRDTARQATGLYRRAGCVGPLRLDVEEYTYQDGHMEPPLTVEWIEAFVDECDVLGVSTRIPVVYTRLQYIRDTFPGGLAAFATLAGKVDLWLANYDGVATLDSETPPGFRLVGKQYAGAPIDVDVFDADTIKESVVVDNILLADVDEQNQFDPASYDTRAEYAVISAAACSAASLAAVATDYGHPLNISGALRAIRATGDDVTPELGLLNRFGQAEALQLALDAMGVPASTHAWDDLTRQGFKDVLHSGRPVIIQLKNYLGRGLGHFMVVDGLLGDGTDGVTVADSNAGTGKRFRYLWGDLWREMAGGTAVWPDNPRVPVEPDDGGGDVTDAQLLADNAALKDQVARLQGERDGLVTRIAVMGDDVGDALQAAVDGLRRHRAESIGPRPK